MEVEIEMSHSEYTVSCLRNALKVLRNDLKSYETMRSGAACSGENSRKSTRIQVLLRHLFVKFQCTHHPPRARSTIAQRYDSETADQGQTVQRNHPKGCAKIRWIWEAVNWTGCLTRRFPTRGAQYECRMKNSCQIAFTGARVCENMNQLPPGGQTHGSAPTTEG